MNTPRSIELLAPARDALIGMEAIKHGADAVYIGARAFGARAAAGNSIESIRDLTRLAHVYNARVYVTVNTIIYDHELREVEKMVKQLYDAGVDALIVQDMSLLKLDLPPIALHASTQCDIRTPAKAQFLESMGFSQLVLARELSLNEIREIKAATRVPLEGFCHGALCVSYSGRCQISQALKHRSANRGECAQFCRLSYDLEDDNGNCLMASRHLLSLRDFNASSRLEDLIDAGLSSFKIEGRLKDAAYVKNIVAHYRRRLDAIIERRDDLQRSSAGTSTLTFDPAPEKSFNRSFTHYFLDGRHPANGTAMASLLTPKSQGEAAGTVTAVSGNVITVDAKCGFANGDGLSFFNAEGAFDGFRVNRVEGNRLILKEKVAIKKGDKLFKTFDKAFNDLLAQESAKRKLAVDFTMWSKGDTLFLKAECENGSMVVHSLTTAAPLEEAKTPQLERQRQVLAKLGDTPLEMRQCAIEGNAFVPASTLTTLRRETVELLLKCHAMRYHAPLRGKEDKRAQYGSKHLLSQDNVANSLARSLYLSHGVETMEQALECDKGPVSNDRVLMHTRYCLRRELGACLKDKNAASRLPRNLFLRNGKTRLRVVCDCQACEMKITIAPGT